MQLNLESQILNLQNRPFADPDSAYTKIFDLIVKGTSLEDIKKICQQQIDTNTMTIRSAILFAVINSKKDKNTPDDTYKAYQLAQKIAVTDSFSIDELNAVKKHTGEIFQNSTEVLGFIWDFLENQIK